MILTVTLNPCVDVTLIVDGLKPYDTNRVLQIETDAGGKGINLSRVATELNARTIATGFIGGRPGLYIKSILDHHNVKHDFVIVDSETRTNTSVEDGSGKPPTTFNSKGSTVSEKQWNELLTKVGELISQAEWVTLGGSIPPGVPLDAYKTIGRICQEAGSKVALDADGEAAIHSLEMRPHFFKPNTHEAERLLGQKISTTEDAIIAAQQLLKRLHPDGICVVSMGKNGAVLASADATYVGEAIPIQEKSTIGSGDSMIAGILTSLIARESLEEALRVGLAAGAATAMTGGAEIANRAQIDSLLPRARIKRVL